MPDYFRLASFNVENLFGRAKVFNYKDQNVGNRILSDIDKFSKLLRKKSYTPYVKGKILTLYNTGLKDYIKVRENRGKLFKYSGWAVTGVAASGAGDWDGEIEFKRARFNDIGRKNTAKVIKDTRADIVCIAEVENRPVLRAFDTHLLNSRYKYEMLIDCNNDPRGIDVGLYSKFDIGGIWTHMFDKMGNKSVFSRDCLEVELFLPDGQPLYILCNHFKSRGYDYDGTSNAKRKRQATRVAEILKDYDLRKDWVVVAGDLNDNPASKPLEPLLSVRNMHDVLKLQYPNDPMKRWTYHYNSFEQIDFLLVSKPLKERFRKAGVERRGMYNLKNLTTSSNGTVDVEQQYSKVTHASNAASDHGAVWAEFDF